MSDMTPERIHVRWGKAGDTRVTFMEERFVPPDNGAEYIRADVSAAEITNLQTDVRTYQDIAKDLTAENEAQAARIADLERQLAEARADTDQAVARAYQRAADALPIGPSYGTRATPLGRGRSLGFADARQEAKATIRALAPADALAEVGEMRAELREARMQSLSDLGQAQDAWEAQKAAEAEVARLKAAFRVNMLRYGPPGMSHEEIDAAISAALSAYEGNKE